MNLKSKLPNVGTTIFTVMSRLANEHKAINLSQGFPNFLVDDKLLNLCTKYMKKGFNQYAPMPGVLELRKAIRNKYKNCYNVDYDFEDEITITAGATQAIYTIINAFIREDDEVIVFSPAYDCYEPAIELNGGKAIHINLKAPNYKTPWENVKNVVNHRTKMIIVNSPHNPTGTIFDDKDLVELDKITSGTDIIVLSDEVYEHIIFDGNKHQSVALNENLFSRSFIVASFGKTFHATGWKMGYTVAPSLLMEEFRKVHQFNVFSCNTPIQYALAEYLNDENNYLSLPIFYQEKRDFFLENIKGSRFEFIPSSGTYFQLLNYKNISKEKDTDLAKKWTINNKIASIPISVFYHDKLDEKMLRFCFAKDEKTINHAAKILREL